MRFNFDDYSSNIGLLPVALCAVILWALVHIGMAVVDLPAIGTERQGRAIWSILWNIGLAAFCYKLLGRV